MAEFLGGLVEGEDDDDVIVQHLAAQPLLQGTAVLTVQVEVSDRHYLEVCGVHDGCVQPSASAVDVVSNNTANRRLVTCRSLIRT